MTAAVDRATSTAIKEEAPLRPGASRERAVGSDYAKSGDRELSATERHTVASEAADPVFRKSILSMQAVAETADLAQRGHATFYPLMALARRAGSRAARRSSSSRKGCRSRPTRTPTRR